MIVLTKKEAKKRMKVMLMRENEQLVQNKKRNIAKQN